MQKITLAEALLRRKELQEKVDQLREINVDGLFEVKMKRQKITEDVDDIIAQVPRITMNDVTDAYDFHAKRLRKIDAIIQQANWNTKIEVEDTVMQDYEHNPGLDEKDPRKIRA